MAKLQKLLITGAAGRIGTQLRPLLGEIASSLRLSDICEIENVQPHEEVYPCDLSDRAAVRQLLEGCDGVLHLGGIANEQDWDDIRDANIEGVVNLYEAARLNGHPRIVFASSYHVIGFYPQDQTIDSQAPARPDGLYGVSKVFGEALASMYHDKFGQQTAIVRIGSCFPDVHSHRMMKTWFSADDFVRLIARAFAAPDLGCTTLYGVSDNEGRWWINDQAEGLGWQAQDSSAPYEKEVAERFEPPASGSPDDVLQGGVFTTFQPKVKP